VLAVSYPYSGLWRADVDGSAAAVYRAYGREIAVVVPEGRHRITWIDASPSTRVGALLSGAAFVALGAVLAGGIRRRRVRIPVMGLLVVGTATGLLLWASRLYGGQGLGTAYTWSGSSPSDGESSAYGRRASASSNPAPENFHSFHASRAVDGSRETWFRTAPQRRPWWEVDLGRTETLQSVTLWPPKAAGLPEDAMVRFFGEDGSVQAKVAVRPGGASEPRRGVLDRPVAVRRVRVVVQSEAEDRVLALAEVELHGPTQERAAPEGGGGVR